MSDWDYDVHSYVRCPTCGKEMGLPPPKRGDDFDDACMVHLAGVRINAGGRVTEIDGTGRRESIEPASGRGTSIAVRLLCESGHAFVVAFQFHKGCTFADRLPEPSRDAGPGISWPHTMWRD
jgi:hypothetical protein